VFATRATVFSSLLVTHVLVQDGSIEAEDMRGLLLRLWLDRLWKDQRGQDMIEYGLMACAVLVAVAAILPTTLMPTVSNIFSRISSVLGSS
jgi:Flp pilus assembly pilin Flp